MLDDGAVPRKDGTKNRASWREDEQVIGVDLKGDETGPVSRSVAHGLDSVLHRAFMVLLVDEAGRLLLCRRSAHKRLWPLYWADSCAGHPMPGESTLDAATRRVKEELGCTAVLEPIGNFIYKAQFEEIGYEYELCHAFIGDMCEVHPDPAEVVEVGLFDPLALAVQIAERPDEFAPWLVECLRTFPQSVFMRS